MHINMYPAVSEITTMCCWYETITIKYVHIMSIIPKTSVVLRQQNKSMPVLIPLSLIKTHTCVNQLSEHRNDYDIAILRWKRNIYMTMYILIAI